MEHTVIRLPNQEASAAAALERNVALAPSTPPFGLQLCCGQVPLMRRGGAILTSLDCPVCGRTGGAWSLDDEFLVESWNRSDYGDPRRPCHGEGEGIYCLVEISIQYQGWGRRDGCLGVGPLFHSLRWPLVSNPAPGVFRLHERWDLSRYRELCFAPTPRAAAGVSAFYWPGPGRYECAPAPYAGDLSQVKILSFHAGNAKWSKVLVDFFGLDRKA